jgi:hypothetical protein
MEVAVFDRTAKGKKSLARLTGEAPEGNPAGQACLDRDDRIVTANEFTDSSGAVGTARSGFPLRAE